MLSGFVKNPPTRTTALSRLDESVVRVGENLKLEKQVVSLPPSF